MRPRCTLAATTLDAPDAPALARFYRNLLDWPVRKEEPGWVEIGPPGGGAGLSFQTEPLFTPPRWPSERSALQMMLHLDIEVTDLPAAVERAVALGPARPAPSPRTTYGSCTTRRATRSASSRGRRRTREARRGATASGGRCGAARMARRGAAQLARCGAAQVAGCGAAQVAMVASPAMPTR
ncbi:VOC family protein [Streptomyces longwoodensis]|uniref:VOC family protein n=1 Tax=Streptomyces longwoodensis TaxID=68231 RepID=UPI0033DB17B6